MSTNSVWSYETTNKRAKCLRSCRGATSTTAHERLEIRIVYLILSLSQFIRGYSSSMHGITIRTGSGP
jgi:hypothetical protein